MDISTSPISTDSGSTDQETHRTEIKLACFRVGDQLYSLDLLRIKEVIRPLKLTPVPKAPIFIEGVINLRGVVIPVVDLRKRFDQPAAEADTKTRILICVLTGKIIGLIVDEVIEIETFTRNDIQPAPRFIKGQDIDYFLGVCQRNEDLVMIVNLEKILSTEEKIDLEQIRNHVPDTKKIEKE